MEKVLITGCSSGFGRQTALLLGENGYHVTATTRDRVHTFGNENVHHMYLDMRDLPKSFDDYDITIFNAGILDAGLAENMSDETIEQILEVNVISIMKMAKMIIKRMKGKRKGKLIFISSMASKRPLPNLSIYNASKAAIEAYAKSLYLELAPYHIEVYLISPGFYKTSLWDKVKESKDSYEQALNRFALNNKSNRDISEISTRILDICNGKYQRFDSVFSLKEKIVVYFRNIIYTKTAKRIYNIIFSEVEKR